MFMFSASHVYKYLMIVIFSLMCSELQGLKALCKYLSFCAFYYICIHWFLVTYMYKCTF